LIPLIIEDCNLPDILAHFAYINWRVPSDEEYNKLLASCLKSNPEPSLIIHNPDDVQPIKPKHCLENKDRFTGNNEDERRYKRENAGKIVETVIRPLRDCAKSIKPKYENGEYINDLENRSIKLDFKFDGYEFIRICEESNRFRLKDDVLVLIYKRDEILNKNMPQIIKYLNSYKEHFIALRTAVKSLNTSNIPTFFEREIAALIKNPYKITASIEDERKEEFLFKLYATVITGKESFSGHVWATTLKDEKSMEILEIIEKDPYSKQTFNKIESLKIEIVSNIDKLIKELDNLDEELQNAHCL
jgi:hypothetical protein